MKATNKELYDKALEAITELFSDTSVSKETAIENLNTLLGEIEVMIESLEVEE